MSNLADLIKELCPDGVEYKPLGEVAELRRGQSITKKNITPGDIPVIAGGRKPAYFTSSANRTGMTIVVAGSGAYAGFVSYWDQPIFVSDAFSVKVNEEILVPRFTYHWMCGKQKELYSLKSGGGVPHVYPKDVAKFKCPIPPLEVQCEIVRILDQFTTLEAELEAELEARRAQYEYYRNQLLSYDALASRGPVEWVKLKDIVSMRAGSSITSKDIATVADSSHVYPCYGANGIRGYVSAVTNRDNASIIGRQGALSGNISFAEAPFFATEHAVVVTPKVKLVLRWLYHTLIVAELSKYVTKSAQPGLSVRRLEQVEVLFPSIEEQQRIADVLDRFDALVNDISSGLPAEIAARRAQYEYYRDRLLSFPEKK